MGVHLMELAGEVVTQTLAGLPTELQERLSNVPVLVEIAPGPEDVDDGILPDTLGFFDEDIEGMPRIRLWIENIRAYAEEEGLDLEGEIRTTLLHEIGHLVGWNEDDLDARGLS